MATKNKYKKGDWVRGKTDEVAKHWNDCWSQDSGFVAKADSVFKIGQVNPAGNRIGAGSVKLGPHWPDECLEPWQPKVGERVRVPATTNTEWVGEGEVTRITDICIIVKMLSGKNNGNLGGFYHGKLEPITDTLPVAEQPAALTIQAGRFYKTRDGRKVGPMAARNWGGFFDDSRSVTSQHWSASGTFIEGCISNLDLVAEWVDTPVTQPVRDITAATVDAINDEYGPMVREVPVAAQQARLKVGDRVKAKKSMMDVTAGQTYEVVEVDPEDEAAPVRIVDDAGDLWWLTVRDFEIVKSATPAIVCKIDNGQPLPATRPVVHSTVEAADAEAKRLANLHTGQEFGVYALTGTPHRVARVYDHEWQRLAAAGEKIQAIKALRNMAALDLVTAKRAVEVFIDKAA